MADKPPIFSDDIQLNPMFPTPKRKTNNAFIDNRASVSQFSLLVTELQEMVIGYCGVDDILALAQTSRSMCALTQRILYYHVNLSRHNEEGLFDDNHFEHKVDGTNQNRYIPRKDRETLARRQTKFANTVIANQPLATSVRSLTWAVDGDLFSKYGMRQVLWLAFRLLIQVQVLDLFFWFAQDEPLIPPPIFPLATTIRIGGTIEYEVFRSLITSPGRVESLELNNIQGVGQLSDIFDECGQLTLPRSPEILEMFHETEDDHGIPILRHHGPMRRHLYPLVGQFVKLKSLTISTVVHDDFTNDAWSKNRERMRYIEISRFIESARPTLIKLEFEQGMVPDCRPPKFNCRPCYRWKERFQKGRPMDTYLLSYVLPTLVKLKWPCLEEMSIRGVGGEPREWKTGSNSRFGIWEPEDQAVLIEAQQNLRKAIGTKVKFIWDAEFGRRFYMEPGSDYSDPATW